MCLLLLAGAGCDRRSFENEKNSGPSDAREVQAAPAIDYTPIYERATASAKRAVMFKPKDSEGGLAAELAPLIIYDVADELEGLHPIVTATPGRVSIDGRNYDSLTYRWAPPDRDDAEFELRLILDARGFVVIYEVVDWGRDSTTRTFFVSRSLEESAAGQYGEALEGRRFATEPPVDTHPAVIVARMLEDGPQPMGPIVLIDHANDQIFSLSCRCMPSQIDDLIRTDYYDLVVDEEGDETSISEIDVPLRLPEKF